MALSRIRAAVEISRPVVTVESYGAGGVVSTIKPVANATFVLPFADVQWVTVTYGAELDFRGLNRFPKEFQFAADLAAVTFGKTQRDSIGTVDVHTLLLVKKNPNDNLNTVETRRVTYQKPLVDTVDATDDLFGLADADDQQTMFISKSLPIDAQQVSDTQHSTVHKPFTEPKTTTDSQVRGVAKARTDQAITSEARAVTYEKPLFDTIDAGDELNGSFVTDDGQVMFLVKPFADSFVSGDEALVEAGKTSDDGVAQTDYLWPFEFEKGVEDTPVTADPHTFFTEKPLTDGTSVSDPIYLGTSRPVFDRFNSQKEGPNAIADYFAQDFGANDYVLTGIPAFDFSKARSDVATTGESIARGAEKQLSDGFISADALQRGVSLGKSDAASTGEIRVFGLSKPLADQFSKSDAAIKGCGKALTEAFGKSDNQNLNFGKVLADESFTVDNSVRYVNKYLAEVVDATDDFSGAANADDDQTMSFVTSRSESVSKSDVSNRGVDKALTDSVSKSDSGSFRMTSYCDVNYFTSDFVGITSTF